MKENIALLLRNNYLAIIAMHIGNDGGQVLSLIPPDDPTISEYTNADDTEQGFQSTVSIQEFEGWEVVHTGRPNWG